MPTFVFTSPDGREHEVSGPEGATQEQAFQILQSQLGTQKEQGVSRSPANFAEALGGEGSVPPEMYDAMGGDVARDFFTGAVKETGRFGAGIGQKTLLGLEALRLAPAGTAGKYTEFVDPSLQPGNADPSSIAYNLGGATGTTVAGMGVVGPVAKAAGVAPTALGRIGQNAGIGAILGGLNYQRDPYAWQESLKHIGTSAAFGGVVGAGIEGVNYLRPAATLARKAKLNQLKDTAPSKEAVANMADNGIDARLSSKYRSPEAAGMEAEAEAANPTAGAVDRLARWDKWKARADSITKVINPNKTTKADAIVNTANAVRKELDSAITQRSNDFKAALAQADAMTGGKQVIDPTPAITKITAEISRLRSGNPSQTSIQEANVLSQELSSLLKKPKLNALDTPVPGTGEPSPSMAMEKLSVKNLQDRLSQYGEAASGVGKIGKDLSTASDRRVAGVLKDAFDDTLTSAESIPGAGKILSEARTGYAKASQYISSVTDSTIGKIVGNQTPIDQLGASKVYGAIKNSTPEEKKALFALVEKHYPGEIGGLKEAWLTDILSKSPQNVKQVAYTGPVDPSKALNTASNRIGQNDGGDFNALFSNPKENQQMRKLVNGLRLLAEQAPPKSAQTVGGQATDVAGNIASRSVVFIMRTIARRATPQMMSKLLLTPEGRAAVEIAMNPTNKIPSSKMTAAANYMQKFYEENKEELKPE